MEIISLIETSDAWRADLLSLPNVEVARVCVSMAQMSFPICRCSRIRALMPAMRRWQHTTSAANTNVVVASLFRYCYDSGLFHAGHGQFLELPISRWPVTLSEAQHVIAEDCVLEAANSIGTKEQKSFFGVAGSCLQLAEQCFQSNRQEHRSFRQALIQHLHRHPIAG